MHATAVYPTWALMLILGVLGACFASFLCVVAERVPAHRSLNGRSTCVCGRQLRAIENIPVVSWCALRGTSSCCHSRIPLFYVVAEATAGLWFALAVVLCARVTLFMVATDVFVLLCVLALGLSRYYRTHPPV